MLKSQVGQNTSLLSLSTHFKTVSFSSVVKQLYMTKSHLGCNIFILGQIWPLLEHLSDQSNNMIVEHYIEKFGKSKKQKFAVNN